MLYIVSLVEIILLLTDSCVFQNILGNLFHGQMLYHAKALETYTKAYQNLMAIDGENDLEVGV